jgi:hypothetical protein
MTPAVLTREETKQIPLGKKSRTTLPLAGHSKYE